MPERRLAESLYDRYHVAVYRYIRRSVRAEDVATDLTQEVFVEIVRSLRRYEPRGTEAAWVFAIAHHVLATHAARRARAPVLEPITGAEAMDADGSVLVHASLHEALEALPADAAEILQLRELVGLSYREIAHATGLTVDGVRARLARVRRRLARTVVWPTRRNRQSGSE